MQNVCAICQEDLPAAIEGSHGSLADQKNQTTPSVCQISCSHQFHSDCIWKWALSQPDGKIQCPVCRHPISRCQHMASGQTVASVLNSAQTENDICCVPRCWEPKTLLSIVVSARKESELHERQMQEQKDLVYSLRVAQNFYMHDQRQLLMSIVNDSRRVGSTTDSFGSSTWNPSALRARRTARSWVEDMSGSIFFGVNDADHSHSSDPEPNPRGPPVSDQRSSEQMDLSNSTENATRRTRRIRRVRARFHDIVGSGHSSPASDPVRTGLDPPESVLQRNVRRRIEGPEHVRPSNLNSQTRTGSSGPDDGEDYDPERADPTENKDPNENDSDDTDSDEEDDSDNDEGSSATSGHQRNPPADPTTSATQSASNEPGGPANGFRRDVARRQSLTVRYRIRNSESSDAESGDSNSSGSSASTDNGNAGRGSVVDSSVVNVFVISSSEDEDDSDGPAARQSNSANTTEQMQTRDLISRLSELSRAVNRNIS